MASLNLGHVVGADGIANMKLIWSNPSPTSSFPAQTLTLDLSGYSAVLIRTRWNTSTAQLNEQIFIVGGSKYPIRTSNAKLAFRNATVNKAGIAFETGCYLDTYGGSFANSIDYVIPTRIYGLKGVIT